MHDSAAAQLRHCSIPLLEDISAAWYSSCTVPQPHCAIFVRLPFCLVCLLLIAIPVKEVNMDMSLSVNVPSPKSLLADNTHEIPAIDPRDKQKRNCNLLSLRRTSGIFLCLFMFFSLPLYFLQVINGKSRHTNSPPKNLFIAFCNYIIFFTQFITFWRMVL